MAEQEMVKVIITERKKRPRVDLTVAQKQEICRFYEKKPDMTISALQAHFSAHFGLAIGRSTIGTIVKRAEHWNSVDFPENVKRTCSPKFAALERDVFAWICESEDPVPELDFVLKATDLVEERNLTAEWNAKLGWATSFKRRFNLVLVPFDDKSERGYRPGKIPEKAQPIRRVKAHIGRRPGYSPKLSKLDKDNSNANTSSIIYDAAVENILEDMDDDYDDDDHSEMPEQKPRHLMSNVASKASVSANTNIIQEAAIENILPGSSVQIMHPGDETVNNTVSSTATEEIPVVIQTSPSSSSVQSVTLPSAQDAMKTLKSFFEQNAVCSQEDLRHLQALDTKLKWLSAKEAVSTLRTFLSTSEVDYRHDIQHLNNLDQRL